MELELGRVTDRKPPFKFSSLTRVGFSDTDAQGIVYYGRYFPYFDVARVEYFRHLHLLYADFEGDLVLRALNIEYHAPARFDDLLEVFIRVERIGRTSMTFEMAAYRVDDDVSGRGASDARPRRPRGAEGVPDPGPVPDADPRVRRRRRRALTEPWPGEGIAARKLVSCGSPVIRPLR